MKRFFTFTLSLLLPVLLVAQSKTVLLPNGDVSARTNEVLPKRISAIQGQSFSKITPYDSRLEGVSATVDTLQYADIDPADPAWTVNFGFFGQDVMLQWFVAPADMDITGVGFSVSDNTGNAVSVKLVSLNWTKEQMAALPGSATYWGYYEAPGNGFNDVEPFIDNDHGVTVGDWVDVEGSGMGEPFGNDIWSDGGYGAPVSLPEIQAEYWVSMDLLGFNPSVLQDDVIGVVVKNDATTLGGSERAGLYASQAIGGLPGWKFYADGRTATGAPPPESDAGWWSREYTWAVSMAVELTGDRAPVITDVDALPTTLSTQARTVTANITDDNPSGGNAGVATANIMYTTDEGATWNAVAMSVVDGDVYGGDIPGQVPGTDISYYVEATDVEGLSSRSPTVSYSIFKPESSVLFLYDGESPYGVFAYMYPFFYGYNVPSDTIHTWDQWDGIAYGGATLELLESYEMIYWVTGFYPQNVPNTAAFDTWMKSGTAESPKRLFVTGQDFVGRYTGFADSTFAEGTFESMIGIGSAGADLVQGTTTKYFLDPVADDPISGYIAAATDDTFRLAYDVGYDANFLANGGSNWIDNLVPAENTTVFMTDPNNNDAAVGVYRSGEGFYGAYLQPDPYCLTMVDPADSSHKASLTDDILNIFDNVLTWMDYASIPVGLEEIAQDGLLPSKFNLKQNYPNPFNPTTTIELTVPAAQKVTLKVFDITGKEVATLVNDNVAAGSYKVNFDASNLASGLYVYTVEAGSFRDSKKMLLVK